MMDPPDPKADPTPLPVFPAELWLSIVATLDLQDLINVSITCKPLRALAHDTLTRAHAHHAQLRAQHRQWSHAAAVQTHYFAWHALLLAILRGDTLAALILEIHGSEDCHIDASDPPEHYARYFPFHRTQQLAPADDARLRAAVAASPWILPNEKEEYVRELRLGNEDVAMCVLLPLLPNLRHLSVPINTQRLQTIVGRIAAASVMAHAPCSLALSRLLIVSAPGFNDDYGIELESLAPFAALPSVRRLVANCVRDHGFKGWPIGVPPGRVPEVYLMRSTVLAEAIRGFAAGFAQPFVMRQQWYHGHGMQYASGQLEWDRYEVGGELDAEGVIQEGTRRELLELRHDEEDHDTMVYLHSSSKPRRFSGLSDGTAAMIKGDLLDWKSLLDEQRPLHPEMLDD